MARWRVAVSSYSTTTNQVSLLSPVPEVGLLEFMFPLAGRPVVLINGAGRLRHRGTFLQCLKNSRHFYGKISLLADAL
jgi:hypothetical protein